MSERGIVARNPVGMAGPGHGPAHAVLIDFASEAEERGARTLANFSLLRIGGVNLQLAAGDSRLAARFRPCLAADGLAVAAGRATDANTVGEGQMIQIAFFNAARTAYRPLTIESLAFSGARGSAVGPANDGFISVMTDRGAFTGRMSEVSGLAGRGGAFFADTRFVLFGCIDAPFAVAAIGVDDAPVSNPLYAFRADAGLGFAARRKKNA